MRGLQHQDVLDEFRPFRRLIQARRHEPFGKPSLQALLGLCQNSALQEEPFRLFLDTFLAWEQLEQPCESWSGNNLVRALFTPHVKSVR